MRNTETHVERLERVLRSSLARTSLWALSLATLVAALAFASIGASPAHAQSPWSEPLVRAHAAYDAGRFAEAARLFAEADRAIGGWQYDEDAPELAPELRDVRQSLRCPWALSQLALGSAIDELERDTATAQARYACTGPHAAAAALLLGDPLEAAIRLEGHDLPPPFARRTIPADARAFAAALARGAPPAARDATEAGRFARARVAAEHTLGTSCYEPSGIAWTGRGVRRPVPDWDSEDYEEPPAPAPPFTGGVSDALAVVRCSIPPQIAPEERGMDGAETVMVVLRREPDGTITQRGSYRGFPELECWTGVVQGDVSAYELPLEGGAHLYAFERVEGYEGYTEEDPSYVVREIVLCDLEQSVCRTLPTAVDRRTVEYPTDPDAEPIVRRTQWDARVAVRGGRLVLSTVRGAPAALRRFGRGVPLASFFREPAIDSWETHLYPAPASATPAASATAACPWRIADPDGETNVRPEPGTSAAPIGTVASGTEITPVERRGRWWRIETPVAGWIWAPNVARACD